MEILGMNVLLPAKVHFRLESGTESDVFCYFDPTSGEVIVTSHPSVIHADEMINGLHKLIREYIKSKRHNHVMPPMPEEGFSKLRPETYINKEEI